MRPFLVVLKIYFCNKLVVRDLVVVVVVEVFGHVLHFLFGEDHAQALSQTQ